MVLLTEGDDERPGRGLFGLGARASARGKKEGGLRVMTELVTEDTEGARRVAEAASDLLRGELIQEESAQRLVLPVFWVVGAEKEVAGICYFNWCFFVDENTVLHTA